MSNLYQSLLASLAPRQSIFIVAVAAVYEDGTSLVTYSGGAQAVVRGGSVAVGQNAVVIMGEIRGVAPNLDKVTIDVS